ncbi:MAG: histidinol-phosphate transaminase [Candidatus Marinimicrobia bacterium]|nr:histidinol-phosphate transaminase [Candidatus Neomarinimicrobiota bacterium]|tara:strand:+ start:10034 stop:11125 length:1092 start_codon:yes stop_codon:yes gene_type:complete
MSLVPKHIRNLKPYVAGKTIESVVEQYKLEKIVKLASNENSIGPSSRVLNSLHKEILNIYRYPDSSGSKLRKLLAEKFGVKVDNVVLGSGSEGIMSTIMRTFLRDKDEIIGAKNSFIGFRVLAQASGKKINWVPMKKYHYDLGAMVKKINANTKIIYLANPDNPTGTYFSISEFDNFMSKIPDRVLVILDEAYFEYAEFIEDYPDSMHYRYDNVITLRTFSKVYGLAGLRVGYGFANEKLVESLMKVKLPFEPSILAQFAAIESLLDYEHLKKSIEQNKIGYEFIKNELNKLNISYIESVANFITLVFENSKSADKCFNFLLSEGVIVRPLSNFGITECIRVTIGLEEENRIFINKMKKYLNN